VRTKRLATILAEHDIKRMDFLKIDIEGAEWPILKDSLDIINAHRTVVLFEFNSFTQLCERVCNPLDFAEWVTTNFSHVYMLRRGASGLLKRLQHGADSARHLLHCNIVEDRSVSDILATNAPEKMVGRLMELEAENTYD
jgi:hypothetical protein